MGTVNLAEIEAGKVLAKDLVADNGRFLIPRGTRLTRKHLRVIKIWGVVEADLEGISKNDVEKGHASEIEKAAFERAEKDVRQLFIHTDQEHPAIEELLRLSIKRRAGKVNGKDPGKYFEPVELESVRPCEDESSDLMATQIDPVQLLQKEVKLSTLPAVFLQINETIENPHSSANDIADVISKDTSLSAVLLKIVNSPFYGFPSNIDTLSRAVAIVGTKQLSTLASGINIISKFRDIPPDLIDMKSFWEHSIACGTISRFLASYKGIQNTERLFVGGLLHDIGRLVLYNSIPIQAGDVLLRARQTKRLCHVIEKEILSFDHADLGSMVIKKWKLPKSLENMVKHHHSPKESRNPLEAAIVHVANMMAIGLGIGSSGERFVPPLEVEAWECLGMSPNILAPTVEQLDSQINEMLRFLYPK